MLKRSAISLMFGRSNLGDADAFKVVPITVHPFSWEQELEAAVREECLNALEDLEISNYERIELWQTNLGVVLGENKMSGFDEIFDLPEQSIIREDCQQFVAKLGNEDEDKLSVLSDLESILTFHCKSDKRRRYKQRNGWTDLLFPLIALKLPRSDTYGLFEAISNKFIPRNNNAYHLLRLIILYHDPELCNLLDTKKITPDHFASSWFHSLFANSCNLPVIMAIWDLYFQQTDPFFLFFLALVIIVNARDEIFSLVSKSKDEMLEIIRLLPCNLRTEDVEDFCSLAYYYNTKTPDSYKAELQESLFGDGCIENNQPNTISQALCLPVSPKELITKSAPPNGPASAQQVRFFLIDCRPVQQFNAGHLHTAFHLDSNLMLQEPVTFATAVQGLLSAQQQAIAAGNNAGGEHLCFLGCGQLEDDQYTHMVVASFLQKHTPYVCMVDGGYKAIHEYLDLSVDLSMEDHNPSKCLVCCEKVAASSSPENKTKIKSEPGSSGSPSGSNASSDLFGKIGAALKQASSEMKEKLVDYIVNPTGEPKSESSERHFSISSSSNKHGKPYRNLAPVFSIDDDDDPTDLDNFSPEQTQDYVSIAEWKKKPDVVAFYRCRSLKPNESQRKYVDMYGCYLFITKTHLFALREVETDPEMAHIVVKRPLASISRILNRMKHPNIVTLKYCSVQSDSADETDMDRFFIPEYKEITNVLSTQILKCVQKQKEKDSKNKSEADL